MVGYSENGSRIRRRTSLERRYGSLSAGTGLRRGAVWHRPTCRPSADCTSGVWAFLVNLTLNYLTVGYAVTQDLGMLDGIDFDNA